MAVTADGETKMTNKENEFGQVSEARPTDLASIAISLKRIADAIEFTACPSMKVPTDRTKERLESLGLAVAWAGQPHGSCTATVEAAEAFLKFVTGTSEW